MMNIEQVSQLPITEERPVKVVTEPDDLEGYDDRSTQAKTSVEEVEIVGDYKERLKTLKEKFNTLL